MKFYSKKLKKFFAMICAFCLIVEFSLSGIQVKAAEAIPRITYTVTGEATIGKQITISLNVSNISGLYGGSWDFAYDPNIIKIDEITAGDLISSIPQTTTSNKSGHAYFWFTKTGDTTGVSTTEAKSIAKIKATVLKEGTININTTNSDNSFGVNNKNSLVKLSDMNGDKISYSSEDKSISCIKPVIVLQPGIYQENNSAFKYHGTWDTFAKSEHSDGSIKLSTAKGNFLEFKFKGTGFNWYSHKSIYRGIANVYIDGSLVSKVDTYSATDQFNTLVFSKDGLENKEHTVKIEVTGSQNPNSYNNKIAIDRIQILETSSTLTSGIYQENNSAFKYHGTWDTFAKSEHSDGSIKLSTAKGNFLEFKFKGTGFNWYSHKSIYRGIANVYIDGSLVSKVDTYSATDQFNTLVFSKDGLENKEHTVKIEVTGSQNPNSYNNKIAIDRIQI
ncbi:cohesin domain-containing protein, partial [Clostridium paraputrificum]